MFGLIKTVLEPKVSKNCQVFIYFHNTSIKWHFDHRAAEQSRSLALSFLESWIWSGSFHATIVMVCLVNVEDEDEENKMAN